MSKPFVTVDKSHWEANWKTAVSNRPLSLLNVFNYDIYRLFKRELSTTSFPRMLEIGFAPGKMLRHFEKYLEASCVGYDYSKVGCELARRFLDAEKSKVEIVCQDVVEHPPANERANCAYSVGVVEHFENPDDMVRAHLAGLDQGGKAIIVMPNYTGMNARLQGHLDPGNLSIHNLALMVPEYWKARESHFEGYRVRCFYYGSPSPWMFSLRRFGGAGYVAQFLLNFLAFLVPSRSGVMSSSFVVIFESK